MPRVKGGPETRRRHKKILKQAEGHRGARSRHVRSLERAQVRREEGVFLAEGVRLVREAIDTGRQATYVIYDPDALHRTASGSALLGRLEAWAERAIEADAPVLAAAARTETPSG